MLADTPGGGSAGQHAPAYGRHDPPPTGMPGTAAQQAFISMVAPGAIAAQQRYGIPASVTIAQAIDESGWGQSELAAADHNLFGIKGTGPAGSDMRPTQEYENGIWVTRTAPFRVYHNIAESIADHGRLLATSQAYQHAMANRQVPDAFAAALTGVYATDPNYGPNLIALMRLYNLYRYDCASGDPGLRAAAQEPHGAGSAGGGAAGGGAGRLAASVLRAALSIPGVADALAAGSVTARRGEAAPGRGSGRGRGSRPGVPGRAPAATCRRFRRRSPPTSWRRPRPR